MEKEFADSTEKATLIIPGHVANLVEKKENLEKLQFVEKVMIVDSSINNKNIDRYLSSVKIIETDIVFVGGMERIGVWLLKKARQVSAKSIIFEEGAEIIHEIEAHLNLIRTLGGIAEEDIKPSDINEIWKLNGWMKSNPFNIKQHNLEMCDTLKDAEFLNRFIRVIEEIFKREEIYPSARIVFFDSYLLSPLKNCTRAIEKNILNNLVSILQSKDYEMKQHPNDSVHWKYKSDYRISRNNKVPWEVVRLFQGVNDHDKIYITYGITGVITNELFLLGGTPYVIFMYKILSNYGIEYPGIDLVETLYANCNQEMKERIFFPETFVELKAILDHLTCGHEKIESEILKKQIINEKKQANKQLCMEYNRAVKKCPDELNESGVLALVEGTWTEIAKQQLLINQLQYELEFEISKSFKSDKSENILLRWYIVKGLIVNVRIKKITAYDADDKILTVCSDHDVRYLNERDCVNGFHFFDDCDSQVEIWVPIETNKLIIEATLKFDESYQGILELKNRNGQYYASVIERQTKENQSLETNIKALTGYLEDWENEVKKRDLEIKETIWQREQLNEILVNERHNFSIERDEYIRVIEAQRKQIEEQQKKLQRQEESIERQQDRAAEQQAKIEELEHAVSGIKEFLAYKYTSRKP